jgi:hypothetical protein
VSKNFRKALSACVASGVFAVASAMPVLAGTKHDDGDQPGQGLGVQGAILWFVILPLAIYAVIALLVMGPGWVSAAKKSATDGFLDDPTGEKPVSAKPETASLTYE